MSAQRERTTRLPLFALLAASVTSLSGNMMTLVAVPWFVLETTGSAAKTGLAGFFNLLPVMIAGYLGGALIDRLGFKRTSVLADLASGATIALIPLVHTTVGLEFWQLLVLVFLGALLDAPGETARAALVPEVARLAGWRLERASGAVAVAERGARMAGAPLAGVLIAVVGAANVLWIDAATFALSATLVMGAVPGTRVAAERPKGGYLAEVREGFSFVRRNALLLALVLTLTVTNFLDAAWFGVTLPVYARELFGSATSLGLLVGVSGGGAVVGALTFGAIGHRVSHRALLFLLAFLGVALKFPLLALFPPLTAAVVIMAFAGLASGPINPLLDTLLYERIPEDRRGRVLGVLQATAWMATPLGVLLGGLAVEGWALRPVLLGLGGVYLATLLALRLAPAVQDMDREVELSPRR